MRNSKGIVTTLTLVIFLQGSCFCQEEFRYPKELERDPFEALINAQGVVNARLIKQIGDLDLNGIIYSDDKETRRAIINNLLLKEGDNIGTYTVQEIKPKQVILDKKGKQVILNLREEEES